MIVVVCPAGAVTGGPEALHQLVDMINHEEPGFGAICYAPFDTPHEKHSAYDMYNTPVILKQSIPENALVVLPEILPQCVNEFTQKCALWWLSVDNYLDTGEDDRNKMFIHLSQSAHAQKYIDNTYGIKSRMLTDYINSRFLTPDNVERKPRVMVNPAKGQEFIDEFKSKNPDLEVFGMRYQPQHEVHQELQKSEIYIDFGHHPGRDRFPREAALCGTIVLSTLMGSAGNYTDMPLDDFYKFNTVDEASQKVREILMDLSKHHKNQEEYVDIIKHQKFAFKTEVHALVNTVKEFM